VAIWLAAQIGIDAVLQMSRRLGVQTPLQRYATTALGASEVTCWSSRRLIERSPPAWSRSRM